MKKNIKRLVALTLLAPILIACRFTSESEPNLDESISIDTSDIIRDSEGEIIFDNLELEMWAVTTGDDAQTQDEIIAEFNSMYDGMINVTTRHISRYDIETNLQATFDFDIESAPDLLFTHGARTAEYVDRGWLAPIDVYYDIAGLVLDVDDFSESLLASTRVGLYHYGVPQDVHSTILEMRLDILEKNNLEVPTTLSELINVSEQAIALAAAGNLLIRGENSHGIPATEWRKASSVNQYHVFPFSYGDMWVHEFAGYTALVQNGGSIVASDGLPGWNSTKAVDGLTIMRDLLFPQPNSRNEHPISKPYNADYDVGDGPFRNGDAIFKFNGPWVYQSDLTMFDRDLRNDGGSTNIGTQHIGNLFAGDPTSATAGLIKGEGHAIMLTSAHKDNLRYVASAIFADYMANYSGIKWAKRGHIPALKSVANAAEYKEDPAYEAYIKNWGTSEDYYVIPSTKYYTQVDWYFKEALKKILSTQYSDANIATILQDNYDDCVDYIELYS